MTKLHDIQGLAILGGATRAAAKGSLAAVLALTLIPGNVWAQEIAQRGPALDLSRVSTLYVLDDTGEETAGKLLRLDPDSLVLLVDGAERRVETSHVRRIERGGDSLRNGAIIGAVVGAVFGLLGGGISDCPGGDPGGRCLAARTGLFLIATGVYASIGTTIDALIPGRTTLYQAPRAQRSAGLVGSGTPPSGGLVNLSFRW